MKISYRPRPYVRVRVGRLTFDALIDTGAEISLIRPDIAEELRSEGIFARAAQGEIHVANGECTLTTECVTVPFTIGDRMIMHTCLILDNLFDGILIGIDLWARVGAALPAPPRVAEIRAEYGAESGDPSTLPGDERRELDAFLAIELATFNDVRGPHRPGATRDPPVNTESD